MNDESWLDASLLAVVAAVAVQLLPFPQTMLAVVSPELGALRAAWSVDPASAPPTLSLDWRFTRNALAWLASALLLFWAAREALARGSTHVLLQAAVWTGFAVTLVAVARRGLPGPFANRNHLATWLLMTGSLAAGYLASRRRSPGAHAQTLRLRMRDWLADGHGLLLAGGLAATIAALAATQSRSAILGAVVALGFAIAVPGSRFLVPGSCSGSRFPVRSSRVLVRGSRFAARTENTEPTNPEPRTTNPNKNQEPGTGNWEPAAARWAVAGLTAAIACGVWANSAALASKFEAAPSAARLTIWRETMRVIRDFWATGTGIGTYGAVMLRYQQTSREVHFNQAHSEYLQIASEGGLLVAVPLVAAIVAAARLARRRLRQEMSGRAWVRAGAAAGLAGVAVQSVFETGLRTPANGLLAAVLAAIVLHAPTGEAASEARR